MPDARPSNEILIDVRGAGVERQGRWLIRDVDLTVHRGEIVTLIGPNGSGKSTTAKVAIGALKPDEGEVANLAGVTIGYVPQKLAVDWTLPLTVERLMTLTSTPSRAEIAAALDAVGIPHLGKAHVQTLSGGEFQRAQLARAIARKPDLLVLDEPVQGVDFSGEVALYDLISRVRDQQGCGILLISHDIHVVMASTDRVVCLNGHVCCSGTPETVSVSPAYLELFGKRAAETLAVYRHHHDHTHLPDGRVRLADGTIVAASEHDHGHDHAHGHEHDHPTADGSTETPHAR